MAFDAHKNLAISAVVTAPTPATSGTTMTVTAGEGARFPAPPFNATVWPSTAMPTPLNGEVIRVTARTTDTLTITRAQEGSTARAIGTGDLIAATITAKTLTDLETQAALKDAANVFTASNTFTAANAITIDYPNFAAFVFKDTYQPADARIMRLISQGQHLTVDCVNDAASVVQSTPLIVHRTGDVQVGRDVFEKGRATPLGHWTPEPFNAANFSGVAPLIWTVTAGQVATNRYTRIGKTLIWALGISGATLSGSQGSSLQAIIPGGLVPAATMLGGTGLGNLGGAWGALMVQLTAASGVIDIFKHDVSPIATGSSYIHFTLTFETP